MKDRLVNLWTVIFGYCVAVPLAFVASLWPESKDDARRVVVERAPRGCCGRCDRCGWTMAPFACGLGDCSMRPLPPSRETCAGCGKSFEEA